MKNEILKNSGLYENKIIDLSKVRKNETTEQMKEYYNSLLDIRNNYKKNILNKNEETGKILFLLNSTLSEMKNYIETK